MGFFEGIGRAISKGAGALAGFGGDILSGAMESFSTQGPAPKVEGWGSTLGGIIGDVGEQIFTRTPYDPMYSTPGQSPAGQGAGVLLPEYQASGGVAVPPSTGTSRTGIPLPLGLSRIWGGPVQSPAAIPPGVQEASMLPLALPGGAAIASGLSRVIGTAAGIGGLSELAEYLPSIFGGGTSQPAVGGGNLPYGGALFRVREGRIVPRSVVEVQLGGKTYRYRYAGRPILYSGDLQTYKRVKRIAGRVRRKTGGR
ncbi:unnamed protein product [marine sediment metagenome]|uniref:Uncharacterized protein n=1 Tax=marine sediment metagenome TaxID=412755 RepID=X1KLS7_9ZZZZ